MRGGARTVRRAGSRRARTGSGRSLAGVRYPGPSALKRGRRIGSSLRTGFGSRRPRVPSQIARPRPRTYRDIISRGREGRRFPRDAPLRSEGRSF